MATLNVKNMPDALYRRLQARARRERRSVAQEVTQIISAALEAPAAVQADRLVDEALAAQDRVAFTIDDDVVAKLKAAAGTRAFRTVVNEALHAGIAAVEKQTVARKPFRTRGFNLGPSLIGNLDNVEDALSRAEGENHQ
jgi:plasmid stability protein